uniref:Large ribosomal subunit protein uL3m n=1 Tax=Neospora caninum (strain Liverpool) TaxID=572307 RepID=A0A0F7UDX4_NEOCL|nr:TPA: ribosomal protein L3p, putative [Neospora caninum Liverpool]
MSACGYVGRTSWGVGAAKSENLRRQARAVSAPVLSLCGTLFAGTGNGLDGEEPTSSEARAAPIPERKRHTRAPGDPADNLRQRWDARPPLPSACSPAWNCSSRSSLASAQVPSRSSGVFYGPLQRPVPPSSPPDLSFPQTSSLLSRRPVHSVSSPPCAGVSIASAFFHSTSSVFSPLRDPSSHLRASQAALVPACTRGRNLVDLGRACPSAFSSRRGYDSRWVKRLDRLRESKFYEPAPTIQEEETLDADRIHPLLKRVTPSWNSRRTGLLAYKIGMMSLWDGWGERHAVTVCQVDRCVVMEQRTLDKDGYEACVMGIGYQPIHKVTKPMLGVYIRSRIEPKSRIAEFKCSSDCLLPVGHEMSVRHFTPGQHVFVSGWSKDKGYLGVKKRWGFAGQNASHGVEAKAHSSPGSIGQSKTVNVVWRFKKMAGHAGGDPRVVNCKVFRIEAQRNLIFLKGCVPGYKGSLIKISDARGKTHHRHNRHIPLHFPTFVPEPGVSYPVTLQCPDSEQDPFLYPEIAIPDKEK